jgi:hypothetical protein
MSDKFIARRQPDKRKCRFEISESQIFTTNQNWKTPSN